MTSLNETMRAAVYREYGAPDVVRVEVVPRPRPGPGEVLVRVHASTVSSGDSRMRALRVPRGFGILSRLALGVTRPRKPVLGMELAGVIDSPGPDVTTFAVGERVVAMPGTGLGAHAEYRIMPAAGRIVRLPDSISFEQGAALAFGGTTALHFLRDGAKTKPGERVLVIGASGTVGGAAVRIAKQLGATVTGVTSTANVDRVRALGADRVVDYMKAKATDGDETYDIIFDAVGEADYAKMRGALATGGRLVLCAGSLPQIVGSLVRTIGTTHRVIAGSAPERLDDLAALVAMAEAGQYAPMIDRTFPLERISEAHAHVDTGRKRGSVVITMT